MKTNRLVRSTLAIAMMSLLSLSAYAAAPAINSDMDKVSYSIGYNLGTNLNKQGVSLNSALVEQGLQDGQAAATPAMSSEDMQAAMQSFQKQMMQKMMQQQEQAADQNATASAEFMQKIAKETGVQKLADGVYYKENTAGKGPVPGANDTVTINYKGMLPNGQVFDSSYARKQPATLPVSQVIPGFATALQKMPVGSNWTIYIAPDQAYGKFAPPSIGPNQALVFQVELLSIQKGNQAKS